MLFQMMSSGLTLYRKACMNDCVYFNSSLTWYILRICAARVKNHYILSPRWRTCKAWILYETLFHLRFLVANWKIGVLYCKRCGAPSHGQWISVWYNWSSILFGCYVVYGREVWKGDGSSRVAARVRRESRSICDISASTQNSKKVVQNCHSLQALHIDFGPVQVDQAG